MAACSSQSVGVTCGQSCCRLTCSHAGAHGCMSRVAMRLQTSAARALRMRHMVVRIQVLLGDHVFFVQLQLPHAGAEEPLLPLWPEGT